MTEFVVDHKPPPKHDRPGMFVIRGPGPMFDLGYSTVVKGARIFWKLELRSKPTDAPLRALLDACATAAFERDVRVVGTERVAAMLEDERYVDVRDDFEPEPPPIEREGELKSTPALERALATFVAHFEELASRAAVSERFLTVCAGPARASFEADLSRVRIRTGIQGSRPAFRADSSWDASTTPESLTGLLSGTVAAVSATETVRGTSRGTERLFLESQFKALRDKKKLMLREDASKGDQVRAIRALARTLHPAFVAGAALPCGGEREDAARRIAEAACQVSDVVSVDGAEVLRIVTEGGDGVVYQRPPFPRKTTPKDVAVSDSLRRLCAIFEWPPSRETAFEQFTLTPVYDSPLYAIVWKPRRARKGFVNRIVRHFETDLTGLRKIATGEATHVTVHQEEFEINQADASGVTLAVLRSLIDEGVLAVASDDEASLAAIVEHVLPPMRELAGATDEVQERGSARRIAAHLREHRGVARVDDELESFFVALKELLW